MLSRPVCSNLGSLPHFAASFGLTCALFLATNSLALFAQSTSVPTSSAAANTLSWHFRYDLFQMLFEQNGLRPIQDFDAAFKAPDKTVVVLLGDLRNQQRLPLEKFLADGGALLLASDMPFGFAQGTIRRGPVEGLLPEDIYQGHNDCLRIKDINATHELSSGVKQLITNRSGWITEQAKLRANDWRVMARLPSTTFHRENRSKPLVCSLVSKQLIVVADHSLFTNGMMWHGDNALFAINVSRSLCRSGRNQVLFAVDGQAANSFLMGPLANELPLPTPPPDIEPDLDLEQMLQVANQMVTAVEDSDAINKLLANRPRSLPEPYYQRALLFALAGMLIALSLVKLGGKASKPTRAAVAAHYHVPNRPSSNRRSGATRVVSPVDRGEAAQKLAQHFCREATSSDVAEVWIRELKSASQSSTPLALVLSLALQSKPPHFSEAMLLDFAQQVAELKMQPNFPST